jgi:hypothetical protein
MGQSIVPLLQLDATYSNSTQTSYLHTSIPTSHLQQPILVLNKFLNLLAYVKGAETSV